MKSISYLLLLFLFQLNISAQNCPTKIGIPSPPNFAVRSMAEWEELEAIVVTYRVSSQYAGADQVLGEIIKNAQTECKVIIACDNANIQAQATDFLTNYGIDLTQNIVFLIAPNNSIWVRDYAPNTVYQVGTNQRILVDWLYNNPIRTRDDTLAITLATYLNSPLYSMTGDTFGLVNVGGNFMCDGMGSAFSTRLVIDDNVLNDDLCTDLTEAEIDDFHQSYMGIQRYVKINRMPFDTLDHLDMHWKMLDETTFLVNKYPENVSNHSVLEANIQSFVNTYKTPFNTKYRIVSVPIPPDLEGDYPQAEADSFRTYSNAIFINKTILVPIYGSPFDSLALAIWQSEKPGFKVVGINCGALIRRNGALHCVVKEIGVADPLLIQHNETQCAQLTTQGIFFEIKANHSSGLATVFMFWKNENDSNWQSVEMSSINNLNDWKATIPNQPQRTKLQYYFQATANSGKTQMRPMPAPLAYFRTEICDSTVNITEIPVLEAKLFPNPSKHSTTMIVYNKENWQGRIEIYDILGRKVATIFKGELKEGEHSFIIDRDKMANGLYLLLMKTNGKIASKNLIWAD
jgi:agmatine deiminase